MHLTPPTPLILKRILQNSWKWLTSAYLFLKLWWVMKKKAFCISLYNRLVSCEISLWHHRLTLFIHIHLFACHFFFYSIPDETDVSKRFCSLKVRSRDTVFNPNSHPIGIGHSFPNHVSCCCYKTELPLLSYPYTFVLVQP